jgi:hypothetical protein
MMSLVIVICLMLNLLVREVLIPVLLDGKRFINKCSMTLSHVDVKDYQ